MAKLAIKEERSARSRKPIVHLPEPPEAKLSRIVEVWAESVKRYPRERIELVNGRLVIQPVPGKLHNDIVFFLIMMLGPSLKEKSLRSWVDITLFFGVHEDRYRPDLTIVSGEPRMWTDDHVYAEEALLVVEVVSPSSVQDDHEHKPRQCAKGQIPLYLVIDPAQGIVRLLSQPGDCGYCAEVRIPLGDKLHLPAPFDLTLDTAEFMG